MVDRREFLASGLAAGLVWCSTAKAQTAPGGGEAALRDAVSRFATALNHRDLSALRTLLAADVVWVAPDSVTKESRDDVSSYIATFLVTYDFRLELVRLRMRDRPDSATLVMRGQVLTLPMRDGKYVMVFNRDPLLSRWRWQDGEWRLQLMITDVVQASAALKAEGLE
jgi:ketosteroid isomerase-like protein